MALRQDARRIDRAVFLDKDGTLIDDVPFNVDPVRIRLARGAGEALPMLSGAGYRLVVVSNQPGVARGLFPETALRAVHERLGALLDAAGARLDGFYYCPHDAPDRVSPGGPGCGCRKPAPGLIRRAASDLGIDLQRSWLVGDILDDVEAGRRAGCRTILVDNGNETEWRSGPLRRPQHVAPDLALAARAIVVFDSTLRHEAASSA